MRWNVHQKFHLGNLWNDQLPLILKGPYYRCLIAGVEFLWSVLLRRWAGVAGWTNNKNKTKIWEKENEWAEEKWFEGTKTETKIKRSFYHKVWAKHGSVITWLWLCSALSHRLPLPVGLNSTDLWGRETTQSTGWSLISLIITAAKKLQQESTALMERKYLWMLFYLFFFVFAGATHIFLPLLWYLEVFVPEHNSTLKSLKPKQWPEDTTNVSHPTADMWRAVNAHQQIGTNGKSKALALSWMDIKQPRFKIGYHLVTVSQKEKTVCWQCL